MEIGATIKKYRKSMHLSQTQLGDYLGVSKGTIINWERGRTFPNQTFKKQLAEFFGIDEREFLCKASTESGHNANSTLSDANVLASQLIEMFINGSLSEDEQRTIILMLECASAASQKKSELFIENDT